ncbi:MAG: hypothetical protein ACRYFX_27110 [Janthinobacterium lividum]
MKKAVHQPAQLQISPSKWVIASLILLLGFAGGMLAADYVWAKSGYEFLPAEIIVKPPLPNTLACFPDSGFFGGIRFQKELAKQMSAGNLRLYTKAVIRSSIKVCLAESDSIYVFQVLSVRPTGFNVIATEKHGFVPHSNYILITEQGCYYLHPIPKRRSADYDSLLQLRHSVVRELQPTNI